MKKIIVVLIIGILGCSDKGASQFKKRFEFEKKADSLYKQYNLQGDFILAIVTKRGLQYSYGISSTKDWQHKADINNQQIYIASHTKALTGTLLKFLENDSILTLNAPITKYLPELNLGKNTSGITITIKDLLSHTNGIHNGVATWKSAYLGYKNNLELLSVYNQFSDVDSISSFKYTNHGPILAAMIAEKLTGKSWKELLEYYIFSPLKMVNTSGYLTKENSQILPSISSNGATVLQKGFFKSNNTMHASGGVVSTIDDLSKWLQYNITKGVFKGDRITPQKSFKELHGIVSKQDRKYFTYDRFGYSLGWDLASYKQDTLLTRFGGYGGISFHLSFMPQEKLGIIAFSNEDRALRFPHLMANLAYNLYLDRNKASSLFQKECLAFAEVLKAIETKNKSFVENYSIVNEDKTTHLVGQYTNNSGWPPIEIRKQEGAYEMRWGELRGNLYKQSNTSGKYKAILGVKKRNFILQSKGDSLLSGSLVFVKKK